MGRGLRRGAGIRALAGCFQKKLVVYGGFQVWKDIIGPTVQGFSEGLSQALVSNILGRIQILGFVKRCLALI